MKGGGFSWMNAIQLIVVFAPAAGVYATMTGNDRELSTRIHQIEVNSLRIESAQRDIKSEIKQDLQSLLQEIRELRTEINRRNRGNN